jgi:DNA polymerase elongation subunit (family B)
MYVDAIFDPKSSKVKVVERVKGKRVFKDYDGIFEFYLKDPRGQHKGIHGESVSKVECDSIGEFKKMQRIHSHKQKYESDIKFVNKAIERHYKHQNPADLHIAFFDIETDFDKELGYSQPEDATNRIISVAVHLQWLDQTVCLALPPDSMTFDEAKAIADEVGNTILYHEEGDMLNGFLTLIEDADVLSGWFSEGYDIPYTINRITKTLGRHETRRMCLWDKFPNARTFKVGGNEKPTYDLIGRVHLDYMALYKKFTYEERHSYGLDAIAEIEVGERKVPYDGTLDELYNKDFKKFLEYNIQDTELLDKIDKKLQFIALASSIAQGNCVLMPAALGAVAVTEQAIIVEAHERGMVVPDRERTSHDDLPAAGGWVQHPKKGLHKWVGSSDLNSLYPSVIRCLNMSPETIVGQLRTDETDAEIHAYLALPGKQDKFAEWWNDKFNTYEMQNFLDNDNVVRRSLDFEDGTTMEVTGAELRQIVFDKSEHDWCISANGTIFRNDIEGIIPGLLRRWYAERKVLQAFKRNYDALTEGVKLDVRKDIADDISDRLEQKRVTGDYNLVNPYDADMALSLTRLKKKAQAKNPEELYSYMLSHDLYFGDDYMVHHRDPVQLKQVVGFWDRRQLVKKINLNSLYGGLLNIHCRFYDQRLGQSTTLTGRSIAKHMAAKTNEYLDNSYDHTGRSIIYGDTDSVYFSAYPVLSDEIENGEVEWNKESVIELYSIIADQVSDTFPEFMNDTFNTPLDRSEVIKAGREVCGETGLFIKKKRYAILVYDEEGNRRDIDGKPGKMKAMGLDLRRSDTPQHVQEFLKDILMRTLLLHGEEEVIQIIREFKKEFLAMKAWEKGTPKAVNNLTKYTDQRERFLELKFKGRNPANVKIPGHVMASINWNTLRENHNDLHVTKILDGNKIIVCKLKNRNDFKMTSVAYPVDEPHLPDWFINLPFDEAAMLYANVDKKVENLLGVLHWDLTRTSPEAELMETLFDFG